MQLKVQSITLDPNLQPRNELNSDAIQQYANDMRSGDIFPAVDIVNIDGKHYLTSGWHRVLAAKSARLETIEATVREGRMEDAIWQACGSNVDHDKTGSRRTNKDKQKAIKMALKLERFSNGKLNYSEIARHVGVSDVTVSRWAEKLGLVKYQTFNNNNKFNIVEFSQEPESSPDPTPEQEDGQSKHDQRMEKLRLEEEERQQEIEEIEKEIKKENTAKLNKTNDNIEWAEWSWNPVTGCLHNCAYCYARDIANRFYPEKFQPSFHPGRLDAPDNTNAPTAPRFEGDIGYKNIFTCSMADLFGKWVPEEWITSVLETIERNPQWTFLLLSKFPVRMAEFSYPDNVWLGTSCDYQHTVQRAESAFTKIKDSGFNGVCWLSCEPMMERITFNSLDMFDWVVMGGSSKSTQTPEYYPPFDDIIHLYDQARAAGAKVYFKTNLLSRIREYPS